MPKKCCVPGCTSNYKGQGYTSVFAFPSDLNLKEKWLKVIPRKDYIVTKYSVVCIKHFLSSCIQTEDSVKGCGGALMNVPRKKPKLRDDAVPTEFLHLPLSSRSHLLRKRKLSKNELETFTALDSQSIESCVPGDRISSFHCLCAEIEEHVSNWVVIKSEKLVTCCTIDTQGCPSIRVSVKIKCDFSVEIFCDGLEVDVACFASILTSSLKVDTWSKLETLLMILLLK